MKKVHEASTQEGRWLWKPVTDLVGSAITQQVDGLGMGIREGGLDGGVGVGGAPAGQALHPVPGRLQRPLCHLHQPVAPPHHLGVERDHVELGLVAQLFLHDKNHGQSPNPAILRVNPLPSPIPVSGHTTTQHTLGQPSKTKHGCLSSWEINYSHMNGLSPK